MKLLLATSLACFVLISEIVCPPVAPNPQPVEGDSPEEDPVRIWSCISGNLRSDFFSLKNFN